MTLPIEIDSKLLEAELEELATYSSSSAPSVTRVVFSDADLKARAYLKGVVREANLTVREDAVGNMFARWRGTEHGVIGTGSHIDAIPNSGRFDGTVGVLGGIEAIRALQRAGFQPKRSIELLMFTAEEPTRFGIGCLGSRLLSGSLEPEKADALKDHDGITLATVRATAGFAGELSSVNLPAEYYSAFIELHIEQGAILEQTGIPVGTVENIAGPATLRMTITGSGGHAGAVLMRDRHDAFLAACEIALAVEAAALSSGSADTVATTGICRVFPGAVNSIPSSVVLEIDVRDTNLARRDSILGASKEACLRALSNRGVNTQTAILNADPPANCDPNIVAALERAAANLRLASKRMTSRAYHDSLFMARIAPVAMIFIPCRKGVSHTPDEFASMPDIANGVSVLAGALAELAG